MAIAVFAVVVLKTRNREKNIKYEVKQEVNHEEKDHKIVQIIKNFLVNFFHNL